MLNIDYSVFIQIANFLILLILLNIILYRPIRRIMIRRKKEMTSTEESARDWRLKVDNYSEEVEKDLLEIRKKGIKEKGNFKNQGIEEEREMLRATYSSVEEKIDKIRIEIRDEISKVRQSLQSELDTFSQELAEKILGRHI
jgi:F-type H+-transporting ATPase subunit b